MQDAGGYRSLIHAKLAYDVGHGQIVLDVQLARLAPMSGMRLICKLIGPDQCAGTIARRAVWKRL